LLGRAVCTLSGDSCGQVRDVDVEEKRCQDGSLWDAVLGALQPSPFVVAVGKPEAPMTNQLHDQADYVPVR